MVNRVDIRPALLRWARERSGASLSALTQKFPKYPKWESGDAQPTWRQLEDFAKKTLTPLGYFFLPKPPKEALPIPDFRALGDTSMLSPSPNLLDTVQTMQRRQDWLRETLIEEGAEPLAFVGVASLQHDPAAIAAQMRAAVGLGDGWAKDVRTWQEAAGKLRRAIEVSGVMAVINGVVANNTHRKLDVKEFRGFALCDAYAPLIFVNGADAKSAQMFTLAHELAHVWIGRDGVSGFEALMPGGNDVELFCNKAAAEFLVPGRELRKYWTEAEETEGLFETVARRFKVSPVVAARCALDLGLISREAFFTFYQDYQEQEHQKRAKSSGGDFYTNQNSRVGERFAVEVIRAAKEGRLLYRDAYHLTGLYGKTFEKYSSHLGFDL